MDAVLPSSLHQERLLLLHACGSSSEAAEYIRLVSCIATSENGSRISIVAILCTDLNVVYNALIARTLLGAQERHAQILSFELGPLHSSSCILGFLTGCPS